MADYNKLEGPAYGPQIQKWSHWATVPTSILVFASGAGAVVVDWWWFATATAFFDAQSTTNGLTPQDYVASDHPRALIMLSAALTSLVFLMTIMRTPIPGIAKFNQRYDASLAHQAFSWAFANMAGGAVVAVSLAYAYSMITLSKFDGAYATAGYPSLKQDALPTAALLLTTMFHFGIVGYTTVTIPMIQEVMQP